MGGGGGGPRACRPFYGGLQGEFIDNLPSKGWEGGGGGMREVCFLVPYPAGKVGVFVKQEAALQS